MRETLDAALVDAPCTGTGVLFEKPDLKYRVTRAGAEELSSLQGRILEAVAPMVRPGGVLVYSTCSVLRSENEEQIGRFLSGHPEYRLFPMGEALPERLRGREGTCGITLLPHRDDTEGFYICRMKKYGKAI